MVYKKTNWQDTLRDAQGNVIQKGTPLNAQALGKIEDGIVAAEQKIDAEIQQVTTQLAQTERLRDNITIDITDKRFNAKGDWDGTSGTDDTIAIKTAIAYASQINNSTLFFPKSLNDFAVSETIYIPSNINLKMHGRLNYIGNEEISCLIIGNSDSQMLSKDIEVRVTRSNQSNWENENCIGVKIINADTCRINIVSATNHTIGVQLIGSKKALSYNEVTLGYIVNNKYAIDLTTESSGWCNENSFYGGRIANISNVHTSKSRYGIRITSKDGSYQNNNNNVFYKPSIELKTPASGEAVPVLVENGSNNTFHDVRNESNSNIIMRVSNDSHSNYLHVGYGITGTLDNQSNYSTNLLSKGFYRSSELAKKVYSSGDLPTLHNPYDASNSYIQNVHIRRYADNVKYRVRANSVVGKDGDYINLSSGHGVAVYINTRSVKKFVVSRDTFPGNGGRVAVVCYDDVGNILQETVEKHVKSQSNASLSFNSTMFGGSYNQGSDSGIPITFEVAESVKRVEVIIYGWGSNTCKLKSFSIYAMPTDGYILDCSVWSDIDYLFKNTAVATQAPATGSWKVGKFIRNANATELGTSGFKYTLTGWTCIADGTPGTWVESRVLTGN